MPISEETLDHVIQPDDQICLWVRFDVNAFDNSNKTIRELRSEFESAVNVVRIGTDTMRGRFDVYDITYAE